MLAFGPVPSRRLGRSLGINNIPPKLCTYSCIYCQIGRTRSFQTNRRVFYTPDKIFDSVSKRLKEVKERGETVDYLAFVPDGEPTLDVHLGETLQALTSLSVPAAVITNAALICKDDVQRDLAMADWISIKIDSTIQAKWKEIDRPHSRFTLEAILDGIRNFSSGYSGELTTETMLVQNVNDGSENVTAVAKFLQKIQPATAYISIPTRPPAEEWARAPTETALHRAYQCFINSVKHVEYLIGYEGDAFASSGDPVHDILSITAVHPMREDAMKKLLAKTGSSWDVIETLLRRQLITETRHEDHRYYVRVFDRLPQK